MVRTIRKQLVRRSIEMLQEIAGRPAKAAPEGAPEDAPPAADYDLVWESFGKYIKLGVLEDEANR